MNMIRCPNCHINLTAAESKAPTCPVCGDSLASLHTKTFDRPAQTARPATSSTTSYSDTSYSNNVSSTGDASRSISAAPRLTTTSARRSKSGGASLWWVIPVAVLAIRGGLALTRLADRPSYSPPSVYQAPIDLNSHSAEQQHREFIIYGDENAFESQPEADPFGGPPSAETLREEFRNGLSGRVNGGNTPERGYVAPQPWSRRPSPSNSFSSGGAPRPTVPRPPAPSPPQPGFPR